MRQLLIIIVLFLFSSCKKESENSDSQNSFLDNNMVWYISEYPDYCRDCVRPHKIKLGTDTIINSKKYKSVYDFTGDSIESNIKKGHLIGYLRETQDKKVYWYSDKRENTWKEYLLFDFNANMNDSIDGYKVIKIDSVNVLNKIKKRITLTNVCGQTEVWIDGVGDMKALISRPICGVYNGSILFIEGYSFFKQTCVLKDNIYLYKDSTTINCWTYK